MVLHINGVSTIYIAYTYIEVSTINITYLGVSIIFITHICRS